MIRTGIHISMWVAVVAAVITGLVTSRPRPAAIGLKVIDKEPMLGIAGVAEQIALRGLSRFFAQVADRRFIRLHDEALEDLFSQQQRQWL